MKRYNNFLNEGKKFGEKFGHIDIMEGIDKIDSVDDVYEYIKTWSCGFHFPFNPPDPLRTLLREKMQEFKDEEDFDKIKTWYDLVTGEYKPTTPLPPGAVY